MLSKMVGKAFLRTRALVHSKLGGTCFVLPANRSGASPRICTCRKESTIAARQFSCALPLQPSALSATKRVTARFHCTAASAASAPAQHLQAEQAPRSEDSDVSTQLRLYNSMTRSKEVFTPRPGGEPVSMYVCGVTVYDLSHIGHARVYVAFDTLYRYLRHLGHDVQYVRNFTDIDDKIIARAAAMGEDPLALAARFIVEFHADMDALGCLRPQLEPKATDFVPEMVQTIEKIIAHGHAYVSEGSGDVFFDVASLPGYGRLSGRSQEDNRAGERVAVDARKRGAADFALWKAAKPGEPSWGSPWGAGRPGWHLECSTMIRQLMGPVIDIHGGGRDLVFPHHENELAQSQAAACPCDREHMPGGTDFVRYWLHNGFVNVDSEKMSKSLGNFFTIRDVLQLYHPRALRWFLVSSQYRQPINYTQRTLEEASDRIYYVYQALADTAAALDAGGPEAAAARQAAAAGDGASASTSGAGSGPGGELLAAVEAALNDDLNTPQVMSAVAGALKALNDLLHTKKGKKAAGRWTSLAGLEAGLQQTLQLLGLHAEDPAAVLAELRALTLKRAGLSEADVEAAIEERAAARKAKDYAAGDAVRDRLAEKGVAIMDSPTGTTWRPAVPASVRA